MMGLWTGKRPDGALRGTGKDAGGTLSNRRTGIDLERGRRRLLVRMKLPAGRGARADGGADASTGAQRGKAAAYNLRPYAARA
jgi:hypothetical protein